MGLEQVQKVLAKLYTDPYFREQFQDQAMKLGQQHHLSVKEVAYLQSLSQPRLGDFAENLMLKRLGAVKKLLPRSREKVGVPFSERFLHWARDYTPAGLHKHQNDAIYFADLLIADLRANRISTDWPRDWLCETIAYERRLLQQQIPTPRLLTAFHHYYVWQEDSEKERSLLPMLCLSWRLNERRPWLHLRLPPEYWLIACLIPGLLVCTLLLTVIAPQWFF